MLFNNEFKIDCDVEEYDQQIDNILKSCPMSRESIAKDGHCCFRGIMRNICQLREKGEISHELLKNLNKLGLMDLDEDQVTRTLRALTISEWLGERGNYYERFLVMENFIEEVQKLKNMGHFAGELGNLMVLGMSNFLRLPIVIFSSLENFLACAASELNPGIVRLRYSARILVLDPQPSSTIIYTPP